MRKLDIRTVKPKDQLKLRQRVILLHGAGKSNLEISKVVGYCYSHVSTLIQKYKKGLLDIDSLEPKARGSKHGNKRKLTIEQEKKLKEILIDTSPAKLKYHTGLWSRENIRKVIEDEFGVTMPLRTITDYLKRWGITPKKPAEGASKQNMKAFKLWVETDYPDIVKRSKKENAVIQWVNYADVERESGNEWNFTDNKTSHANAIKRNVRMLSIITSRGEYNFKLFRGKLTSPIFRSFLSCLTHNNSRKIFLILRHHQVHESDLVNYFFCSSKGSMIEIFYLP